MARGNHIWHYRKRCLRQVEWGLWRDIDRRGYYFLCYRPFGGHGGPVVRRWMHVDGENLARSPAPKQIEFRGALDGLTDDHALEVTLNRQPLAILEKALGAGHPDAARVRENIARRPSKMGKTVFQTREGKPLSRNMQRSFSAVLRKPGIKRCPIHDLRRTFVSYLAMAGVNEAMRSSCLGWSAGPTNAQA